MISSKDITVVMQGDLRFSSLAAINSVREHLSDSYLILSTFKGDIPESIYSKVDEVLVSDDPGALPSFVNSDNAALNNINRQLVSTLSGLDKVKTPYVIKIRTDCVFHGARFLDLLNNYSGIDGHSNRLVVSSYYTRHPHGLACYLFHISDWFVFGLTRRVKRFFAVPLMSPDDATWFNTHTHKKNGTFAARRFRARYTPEQYITTYFAKELGYKTPAYLNDWSPYLAKEYEKFMAKELLVAAPSFLGFSVTKYPLIEKSIYQRIDCLGFDDWLDLFLIYNPSSQSVFLYSKGCSQVKQFLRKLANRYRYIIIRLCLL